MISRLFRGRKRLDSEDPAQRRQAVASLSDDQISSAELARLVRTDPDERVRRAALSRLTDPDLLEALLDDERMGADVSARVAELLDTVGHQDLQRLADHRSVLGVRIARNPSKEIIESVLDRGDPELLLTAVLAADKAHREALLGHDLFQRTAVLHELERRSRDHDKRLNRFARDRIDDIRRHRTDGERLFRQIADHVETLEKPAVTPSAQEARKRTALLGSLTKDLEALAEAGAAMARAGEPIEGLDGLARRARSLVESGPTAEAQRGSAGPEPVATPGSDSDPFEPLSRAFLELEQALMEDADFDALALQRQRLTAEWLAAADHQPPEPSQHEVFERVSHRFQELAEAHARLMAAELPNLILPDAPRPGTAELPPDGVRNFETLARETTRAGKTLRSIAWPEWAATPDPLAALSSAVTTAETRLATWGAAVEQAGDHVAAMLEALSAHVDAGELKKAHNEAGRIRSAIAALPRNLAQPLSKELSGISARLSELSDWQTFATAPKREQLCEAMQALADHPLPPKDQAARIKQLRAEWNELGPATRGPDHRLLERFNDMAEKAFEPCREYFAEQAAVRAQNLAAREEICASLATYLEKTDWENADYKAAEQIMRTARNEWRQHHPVDRTPGKPLEARFEKLQAELHGHIKAEWNRNLDAKRRIVADAQALAEADDDIRDRVTAAKQLQQQWKAVGTTPRRPDQALWRDFRKACDAIFAARDDVRRSVDETMQASEHEFRSVIDDFRAAMDTDHAPDQAALRDFQHRFDELPRLPERRQRVLDREFGDLMKSARVALKAARQIAERKRLAGLEELDRQVADMERRHAAGEAVEFQAPDPVFESRWSHVDDSVPADDLLRLTIEAEIAAGLESPESDRERRLAIQVDLMNAGRGRDLLEADPATLADEWCRAGPKRDQVDELRARFFRAIDKLAER